METFFLKWQFCNQESVSGKNKLNFSNSLLPYENIETDKYPLICYTSMYCGCSLLPYEKIEIDKCPLICYTSMYYGCYAISYAIFSQFSGETLQVNLWDMYIKYTKHTFKYILFTGCLMLSLKIFIYIAFQILIVYSRNIADILIFSF